jgi:DNA-binding response OmpR family regulator
MIVVEGDELVRQGLARILVDAGYEAIQARDGLAALRCAWESPADVVLVNMKLPDMSGVELIRQMEQECPGCTVVAISGRRTYGVPDPLAVVAKFKNVRGLRKPFTPAALVDVVKGLMAQ